MLQYLAFTRREVIGKYPSFKNVVCTINVLVVIALFAFIWGCSSDPDAVIVDFLKTVSVDRPVTKTNFNRPLRVAVAAMISPKETFTYYNQLLRYLGKRAGRKVELIQRKTYGEINELIAKGRIDLAFICSGPYAAGKEKYGFELLATPQVQGTHFYHSYLIVNKESPYIQIEDFRGKVFAFTDPDSNTGKLVPTYWLAQIGEQPETFFGKTIFTYSHDNSIMAVARALVDGAAVDSLIWEYYQKKNPIFTSRTRVIKKSKPYGIPPVVASSSLSSDMKDRIRKLLFNMQHDSEGRGILDELMIDKFVVPREEWYKGIRDMKKTISLLEKKSNGSTKS